MGVCVRTPRCEGRSPRDCPAADPGTRQADLPPLPNALSQIFQLLRSRRRARASLRAPQATSAVNLEQHSDGWLVVTSIEPAGQPQVGSPAADARAEW